MGQGDSLDDDEDRAQRAHRQRDSRGPP